MATYFTSDHHLGHANIINLCGRPHRDADTMNSHLIDTINDVVGDDDELWIVGDVVMGKFAETIKLIAHINGRKILVAGNHDRVFPGSSKRPKHNDAQLKHIDTYLEAGFSKVYLHTATTRIAGTHVTICHFPYRGDSQDVERHEEYRPIDRGGWLIHGHVHERWRQRGRMINVAVDAWAGRPVSEHTIAAMIAAGPADLPPHPWDTPNR